LKATRAALQAGLDALGAALREEKEELAKARARHAQELPARIRELEEQNRRTAAADRESLRAAEAAQEGRCRDAETEARARLEGLKRSLQAAREAYMNLKAKYDADERSNAKTRQDRKEQLVMK